MMNKKIKIGIVGTGFIGKGVFELLTRQEDLSVSKVLTRRSLASVKTIPTNFLTNSVNELIDSSELIIECSGHVLHATEVIQKALLARIPVVTMDTEFHVTIGSFFADQGLITEAEGDQPGCLAALNSEALAMGFKPQAFLNIKGYLNLHPEKDEMNYWANKSGISLAQVVSFTDGTKVQMEQALVANGLGADIIKQGLVGLKVETASEAKTLLEYPVNYPISDYVLSTELPAGVIILATHDEVQKGHLKYYKMGDGPYILSKTYHLCHLEILKTVRNLLKYGHILLTNSKTPSVGVVSIAKKHLHKDEIIIRGIGSFQVRGEAIDIQELCKFVPIGLLYNARVVREIEPGQMLTFDDVELPESLALECWISLMKSTERISLCV